MSIEEVPVPNVQSGLVLVKNRASVISAGTEKTTIDNRKSSFIERAKSQPDDVKKVIDEVKRAGLLATYKRVMSKLDSLAPLGYSSAGDVIAVDPSIDDIEIGDRVACAGAAYAYHSDVILVPRNLVARIPEDVSYETAAYSTVATIALQGIRQAEPTLGETVVVIGLGLLGQLTAQMLQANGCNVVGVDLDRTVIDLANNTGAAMALHPHDDDVLGAVMGITRGHGADSVIVTAGTKSNDPIILAGNLIRERGKVIIVGATPMDIPRSPFYQKEVDIRISRSYGPGRYNSVYEEKGHDFPIGYVRWTENRNMQAFLNLAASGKVDTDVLTTHRFPVDDALKAYELIEGEKTEPYIGLVITYDEALDTEAKPEPAAETSAPAEKKGDPLTVGFIGAGSFASGFLVPHLHDMSDVTLDIVCNRTGLTASDMRNKFGFRKSSTDTAEVYGEAGIGTVFVGTRHGDHAENVVNALNSGKNVFVEKPLALNEEELAQVEAAIKANRESGLNNVMMVGFNRRFAPLVKEMRAFFQPRHQPVIVHYYVNAGYLPKDHWTHDPKDGGGRIIGEVCHFIDTIQYLTGETPVRISAENMFTDNEQVVNHDNVNIHFRLSGGSLGIVSYVCNGDSSIPKERITMSSANRTAVMDNFESLILARDGKQSSKKGTGDKGHKNEVQAFMQAIRDGKSELISIESMLATTRATFAAVKSLQDKQTVAL